jgi:putative transposase
MTAYANWLGEYAEKYGIHMHGWVLMTNHVNLLMTPQTAFCIT